MQNGLELDPAERRRLADAALQYAEDYLEALPDTPASYPPIAPDLIGRLATPPPERGRELPELLELLTAALETGIDTSSGKFLSYIPSGGIYSAAIGRLLGAVTNRYTGGTHGAPGLIAIEAGVVRWMCTLFDLPETSSGILLSGGSVSSTHQSGRTTRFRRRPVLPACTMLASAPFPPIRPCASTPTNSKPP
jgi:aromatic-L-amino-acid decarboxylase